jgi:hypothetical protein
VFSCPAGTRVQWKSPVAIAERTPDLCVRNLQKARPEVESGAGMLDANLVAVEWGLIGVFGVVVGLLIEPAHRFLQEFLDSGKATDHTRAARWAASLKITSVLVLFGLFGLSVLGAHDAGLGGSD